MLILIVVMTDVKKEFEKNLYTEIASEREDQSLVKNQVTQQIYLKKTLDVYSIPVFAYLKENHSLHLPAVEAYWEENGKLTVIEELISGRTLEYVLTNEHLSDERKTDIILQICDGLTALHTAEPKIIHRDLKASNIMITNDGIVKIIDYDAAKIYRPDEKKDTVLIGTNGSAAPEQYGFKASDERTDIYALGVLIKQMMPDNPRMMKIAEKASSFAPEQRYHSVQELKDQVTHHQNYLRALLHPPGLRKKNIYVNLLAAVLYAALFISIYQEYDWSDPKQALTGVGIWCIVLGWVDIFGHWTGFFDQFPWMNSPKYYKRLLGRILACAAVFLFWVFVLGILLSFLKSS